MNAQQTVEQLHKELFENFVTTLQVKMLSVKNLKIAAVSAKLLNQFEQQWHLG